MAQHNRAAEDYYFNRQSDRNEAKRGLKRLLATTPPGFYTEALEVPLNASERRPDTPMSLPDLEIKKKLRNRVELAPPSEQRLVKAPEAPKVAVRQPDLVTEPAPHTMYPVYAYNVEDEVVSLVGHLQGTKLQALRRQYTGVEDLHSATRKFVKDFCWSAARRLHMMNKTRYSVDTSMEYWRTRTSPTPSPGILGRSLVYTTMGNGGEEIQLYHFTVLEVAAFGDLTISLDTLFPMTL